MNEAISSFAELMWAFVRGDKSALEFEREIYQCKDLENQMPSALYLDVISFDYKGQKPHSLHDLKKKIEAWLRAEIALQCACFTWSNRKTFILSADNEPQGSCLNPGYFEGTFKLLRERTPWLRAVKCSICGTCWLLGIDTIDDDIIVKRLNSGDIEKLTKEDKFPDYFDDKPNLWPSS